MKKNSIIALLAIALIVSIAVPYVGAGAEDKDDTVTSVSTFAELQAALADPAVGKILLTQRIDIDSDINSSDINGEKVIDLVKDPPNGKKHHFSLSNGVIADFGNNVTLLGGQGFGGITVEGQYSVTIKNLSIIGVLSDDSTIFVRSDAGTTTTLENVTVNSCTLKKHREAGGKNYYGLVYDAGFGTLNLIDCTVSGNKLNGNEAVGIVLANANLVVTNSTVTENNGGYGAIVSLASEEFSLTVTDSTVTGNKVTSGAIASIGPSKTQNLSGNTYGDNTPANVYPYPKPSITVNAVKFKAWGEGWTVPADAVAVSSGEHITDDILKVWLTTDAEDGYRFQWHDKDSADGWRDFSQFVFDFVNGIVSDQHEHKTYEFRVVSNKGVVSDVAEFVVNIDVINVPTCEVVYGTPIDGKADTYESVTFNISGRYVTNDAGYFMYNNGSGYITKNVSSAADYTFTEPGTYTYVRYWDSKSQQIVLVTGSFTIEEKPEEPPEEPTFMKAVVTHTLAVTGNGSSATIKGDIIVTEYYSDSTTVTFKKAVTGTTVTTTYDVGSYKVTVTISGKNGSLKLVSVTPSEFTTQP